MDAKEKVAKLLEYLGYNAKVFSEMLGYERPQIIYDVQKGRTKRISEDLALKITSVFPEINKSWLLAGEGEMLNSNVRQTSTGDNSPNIAGNGNSVINCAHTIDKALEEIAEQRKLVTKSQEQIDRLLAIIEQITKK